MPKIAWLIYGQGNSTARKGNSKITALAQPLQTKIVNQAIQVFGVMGQSSDTPLSYL